MILVGKNTSVDGSVLLAHNNDLSGDVASNIEIIKSVIYPPGSMINMKNGVRIHQIRKTYRMLVMNCYYGYSEGDAKAINEYGVAIAGGVSLMDDRNDFARKHDPLLKNGVSGYIRYIALERSKTARECVELIGKFYSDYGISYASGVGVADYNEAWYIEAAGGKNWVAAKVPDDSYLVAANGYRIGLVDFKDKNNFLYSKHLYNFAKKNGLIGKGNEKKFNFSKTFGGRKNISDMPHYNSRRIWRAQSLLNPVKKQNSESFLFPLTLKPEKKIDVMMLIDILRDYYKDTKYNASRGIPEIKNKNRAIGILDTVHTSVIQLNKSLPVEVGAVIWGGPGSAFTTPYFPVFFGISKIDERYSSAGEIPDNQSAFWIFRRMNKRLRMNFSKWNNYFLPEIRSFEKNMRLKYKEIITNYIILNKKNRKKAIEYLTESTNNNLARGIDLAIRLLKKRSE